jgi:acetyl-CoA C-acetyltransferase
MTPEKLDDLDPRTPVVVGVGQASERLDTPGYRRRSPVDLAADAARDALADTGADPATVAAAVDTVAGTRQFENSIPGARAPLGRSDNFPRSVAGRLGADPKRAVLEVAGGQSPQHLVNEFAATIAAGGAEVACSLAPRPSPPPRSTRRPTTVPTSPSTSTATWKTAATGCAA